MDLVVGIGIVLAITIIATLAGLRVGRIERKHVADLCAVTALALILAYGFWGRDSVLLAQVVPFSNLIVLSNAFPPLTGFLAGILWQKKATPAWRRVVYLSGAGVAAGYSVAAPLLGQTPQCQDQWRNGVCLQTTAATCSAACGATVLKAHGIETSEDEMAALCLTRKGTLWQGLYRGLKLKTAGTPYDVEVFQASAEELRELTPGPMILTVGVTHDMAVDPIYTERYSWTPGVLHSVVLYDFTDGDRVNMGDPSIETGREQWTTADLRVLYRGKGLRLVRRAGAANKKQATAEK